MPTIHFPQTDPVYTQNTTVSFQALVDAVMTAGEISGEALQDHFGAASLAGVELVRAFKAHRGAIEAVARVKLPGRLAAGRGLLLTSDF